MEKQDQCQKCGEPRGSSVHEALCQRCVRSLPHCEVCGQVCGREWGYLDDAVSFTLKNGRKINLCNSCDQAMKKNKYLRTEQKILSEDGCFYNNLEFLKNMTDSYRNSYSTERSEKKELAK